MIALRDYQSLAIGGVRGAYLAGALAVLLVLPTGGGKTICFTYMTARAAEKGLRVLLLAHRRELVSQISAALTRWDVAHGIISPGAAPTPHGVQVAMAQTLAKRVKLDKSGRFRFDLVIVDEAHHATRDSTWGAILAHNEGAKILGVTATPCRLDGKGLGVDAGGFFERLVVGPSVADLIEQGHLAPPVVYAPAHGPDLGGVKKRGGDFAQGQLAGAMDRAALTGDAVAHYRRHCDRRPAIAFTVTTEHAGHVAEEFKAAGYAAAVLTGSTPDKERAQMIRDLGAGQLHVLASCNVVSEGTDIPTVAAAILLRPTASYALAMQQMGRALRTAPGKDKAIILDHAGNCHRHGLPTEPVEWSLAGMQRRGGKAELRHCFDCKSLVSARARACPNCGKSFAKTKPELQADALQSDLPLARPGELRELTPEKRAELRRRRLDEERSARSREELEALGRARGYRHPEGWAKHRYSELRSGRS